MLLDDLLPFYCQLGHWGLKYHPNGDDHDENIKKKMKKSGSSALFPSHLYSDDDFAD